MSFTTGEAANQNDLLDKLRLWLVSIGWVQLRYTPAAVAGASAQLSLQGSGSGAGDEFYCHIETVFDVATGSYGWKMQSSTGYSPTLPIASQENLSPSGYFTVWANTMKYYFYANSRHFKVIAKVSTSYISCYAGLLLPYALPTEYRKPFCIMGNNVSLQPASTNNASNRMIADPSNGSSYYLSKEGVWLSVYNHVNTGTDAAPMFTATGSPPNVIVWPHSSTGCNTGSSSNKIDWSTTGISSLRANSAGELPMIQCQLINCLATNRHIVGALDGVYATGGTNRASEQITTAGSKTLRMFQNSSRNGARDFMAIEEV